MTHYEPIDEQVQCCLKFIGYDLAYDTVRLDSLSMDEWHALPRALKQPNVKMPVFRALVASEFPILLPRDELLALSKEVEKRIRRGEDLNGHALSGFSRLANFVVQAAEQRGASATFEIWPGEFFDEQILLAPGHDVLAELQAMDDEE